MNNRVKPLNMNGHIFCCLHFTNDYNPKSFDIRLTMGTSSTSDPFSLSRSSRCVVVLLCPVCVQFSQFTKTWPPAGQMLEVLLLTGVRKDGA